MEKSQKNGKAGGNQANKQNVPSNEQLDYVYRVLRPDEDPSKGLQARDPNVTNVKPSSHVHGKKRSPYISTCATLEAAEMYASLAKEKGYQTGPLVRINIKKLKQMADVEIIVLNKSHFSEKDAKGRNWAFKYREVLIRGNIPAECIDVIEVFEESEEYDIEDYSSEDQDPEDFRSKDQDPEDFSSYDKKPGAKNVHRSDRVDDESESLSEEFAKRTKISDNEITLFVKDLCGRTVTLRVRRDSTVAEVKEKLRVLVGIPSHMQRLSSLTKELQDHNRLEDYDIQDNSTLHLLMRLKGGKRF